MGFVENYGLSCGGIHFYFANTISMNSIRDINVLYLARVWTLTFLAYFLPLIKDFVIGLTGINVLCLLLIKTEYECIHTMYTGTGNNKIKKTSSGNIFTDIDILH